MRWTAHRELTHCQNWTMGNLLTSTMNTVHSKLKTKQDKHMIYQISKIGNCKTHYGCMKVCKEAALVKSGSTSPPPDSLASTGTGQKSTDTEKESIYAAVSDSFEVTIRLHRPQLIIFGDVMLNEADIALLGNEPSFY